MAGFNLSQLFEDPTFMMGASLLGNNSPDAMSQAIAASQAMTRTKLAKQNAEQEREMEKARTELYRRQVATAEENSKRLAEGDAEYRATGQRVLSLFPGLNNAPSQGIQNASQQPQLPAGDSSLVPGSAGPGEIEPNATQRAVQRAQEDIAALNRELALPNNPEQRMIKTQELDKAQKRLQLLGGMAQQQQAQAAQAAPVQGGSMLPHQVLQALGGYQMGLNDPKKRGEGLIEMSKALKPEFGKPGDINLGTGQPLPDAALQYRQQHDASEAARQSAQFNRTAAQKDAELASEAANRDSLIKERDNIRLDKQGKSYQAHQSLDLALNTLYDTAERLKKHEGLEAITSYRSYVPPVLQGQKALNADAEKKHLEGQVFTNASQSFRRMNETGGSVGQQSDWEGKQFVDSWGRLSQAQGTKEYQDALSKLQTQLRESQVRMKAAYDYYHGKKKGETSPDQFKRIVATGKQGTRRVVKFEDGSIDFID
jgi:hypothetical protein